MNNAYSAIAKYYERLTKDFDYNAYYNAIKQSVVGNVVELGAGTGKFTINYINAVTRADLVENSSEMLGELQKNLFRYRKKINCIHSDMEEYGPISGSVDTVLAVCDVFNYIRDVSNIVGKIAQYLKTGGCLIFDISTEFKFLNVLSNNLSYEDYDDLTYFWCNSEMKDGCIDMDITLFERRGDVYIRHDETSRQYAHKTERLLSLLSDKGFQADIIDGDSFEAITETSQRILFVCKKI